MTFLCVQIVMIKLSMVMQVKNVLLCQFLQFVCAFYVKFVRGPIRVRTFIVTLYNMIVFYDYKTIINQYRNPLSNKKMCTIYYKMKKAGFVSAGDLGSRSMTLK